jgi:protoporphyrinogen oxidase
MVINTVILGAGIAGIGSGYALKNDYCIFEMGSSYGGLLDNFTVSGFLFDKAVHLSFAKEELVRNVFDKVDYFNHLPISFNFTKGLWVKHPIQTNLYNLPIEEKIQIIKSFFEKPSLVIRNYKDWLINQYGYYFSEHYPEKYTIKYWCEPAENLSTEWIGKRMYQPNYEEIIKSAIYPNNENNYYIEEMRYPKSGGYKTFFSHIADNLNIKLNHKVINIDIKEKKVSFENGTTVSYTNLISSLPLPEIIKLIDQVPEDVKLASTNLYATSIILISIGFKKLIKLPSLWFYIYDLDIPFARAHSPSMKSHNNAPHGKSSIQCEVYFSKNLDKESFNTITSRVLNSLYKMGICIDDDIEIVDKRIIKYANVVFFTGMQTYRKKVLDFLNINNISSIGRFGEWDYLWSNQSFISGYNAGLNIKKKGLE